MASPPPPHEPVTGSPQPESSPSPVEEADEHQEFIDSNMPYSPSLNSVDCHLPEYSVPPPPPVYPVDQPPPTPPPEEEQILDNQPPPTATEPPPQNDELKDPPLEQPPPVNVDPPESPNLITNPNPRFEPVSQPPPASTSTAEPPPESPISKPPPSPSPSGKPEKNPNFDTNPKAESPIAQQLSSPEGENNESLALMALENSPKPSPGSPRSPKSPKENSPPLGVPLYNAVTTFIPSKPVISPWTYDETTNLIQAYQEKWYSIKKGPLKAGQWEEVAITIAARCGFDEPTKTSKQCRHKMEKLRKRYRQERGKPRARANAWDYFKLMDNLERGPLPISSTPMEYRNDKHVNGNKRKSEALGGEFGVSKRSARVRNNNVNGGLVVSLPFSDGVSRIVKGLRTPVVHKPREYYQPSYGVRKKMEEEEEEEEEEDDDDGSERDGGEDTVTQLAAEIKGFAEKFVRMEKNKIEMIRDVERYRMEMENKRMEMIRESQRMLVETVNRAFGGSNKTHKLSAK